MNYVNEYHSSVNEEIARMNHQESTPFIVRNTSDIQCKNINFEYLAATFGKRNIVASNTLGSDTNVFIELKKFLDYVRSDKQTDPLYLHLKLEGTFNVLNEDIQIPSYLKNWFFMLPEDMNPNFRWILIGPHNSGTRPHADIMNTSAWNYLIEGEKIWKFHINNHIYEITQHPGDLVVVPSKVVHEVRNNGTNLAITENFVNSMNYTHVKEYFNNNGESHWAQILDTIKEKYD